MPHRTAFAVIAVGSALASAPALAQPMNAGPGGVNPAPGATRPFLGHPHTFYDPMQRLQDIDARTAALPPARRSRVAADVHRIDAFAQTQRARHGDLRDWDRERMTRMMDDLVRRHPELRG